VVFPGEVCESRILEKPVIEETHISVFVAI